MNIHICSFTDVPKAKIYLNGKPYVFEFSERFGPFRLHQGTHELTKIQEFPRGFWPQFEDWLKIYLKDKEASHDNG